MKVELDSILNLLTVDGVRISLDCLKTLANPDESKLYRMKREGDTVVVEILPSAPETRTSKEPCDSVFRDLTCELTNGHGLSHMAIVLGQRVYWTDELVQCDESVMRDGSPIDQRRYANA